jgi:hypothetical protein
LTPFCPHHCLPLHQYIQSGVEVFTFRVIVMQEKITIANPNPITS